MKPGKLLTLRVKALEEDDISVLRASLVLFIRSLLGLSHWLLYHTFKSGVTPKQIAFMMQFPGVVFLKLAPP